MIHEYQVEVICDGAGCRRTLTVTLPPTYEYPPDVVNPAVRAAGWTPIGDDEHYCESCASSPVR